MGAMSLTYRIFLWLLRQNSCWQFSIFSLSSRLSDLILTIIASIFSCESSSPPLRVSASLSFLQQTQSGRRGYFSSWLGCLRKLVLKSLSQFFSSFFTFFFSLARPSTDMASMCCSSQAFLVLFMRFSSRPSFLKASLSLLGAYFSIHSATVLQRTGSGRVPCDSREASLRTEKESFWEFTLPLRELFSCRMSPSNSRTLGLHSMVRDSLALKRSDTVEVTSSLRMSNYIGGYVIQKEYKLGNQLS